MRALADNAGCANGLVTNNSAAGAPAILTLSPAGGSSTFSGAIQDGAGAIHLAISGNGTQVLAGSNNAYSGGTTISAGTLQIGDGAANAGSLPGNVVVSSTAAGALTFNTPAAMSLAYSGNISGAGGLTKAGPGTLTVNSSQTQTYNGATIISGGVLRLAPTTPVGVNMQWTDISSGIIGSGAAGAVPLANWNNNYFSSKFQNNAILSSVFDSNDNTVPGMSIQFNGGGPYSNLAVSPTNNTLKLLSGGLETNGGSITISDIPYSAYDVYVYVSGWDNTRAGYLKINQNAAGYTSGGTVGFAAFQNSSQNSLTTLTATTPSSGQPQITDVEFANVSNLSGAASLTITWQNTSPSNVMVSAIQIVKEASAGQLPAGTTVQLGGAGGTAALDLNGVNQQVAALVDNAGCTNGLVTNGATGNPATLTLSPTGGSSVSRRDPRRRQCDQPCHERRRRASPRRQQHL